MLMLDENDQEPASKQKENTHYKRVRTGAQVAMNKAHLYIKPFQTCSIMSYLRSLKELLDVSPAGR